MTRRRKPPSRISSKRSDSAKRARSRSSAELNLRNRTNHELVEQRNGERHLAVGWAVDHSFADQLCSDGAERRDLHGKCFGNVRGALRTRSERRHCAKKVLFARGQPAVANAEEVLVQSLN